MEYKTEHYVFHCVNNKTAERDIESIAKTQEKVFGEITKTLNVEYKSVINYYLVNTPEEVAETTGYEYPVNGLACFSDKSVYAVYSEKIKCIGPHEDAHLISDAFGISDSDFLSEGLAMYFDKCWWGVKNELWCRFFIEENIFVSPAELLNNRKFGEVDCSVTYPIAGAFTAYLIKKFGVEKYRIIYTSKEISSENAESPLYKEFISITDEFIEEIKSFCLGDEEKELLKKAYLNP